MSNAQVLHHYHAATHMIIQQDDWMSLPVTTRPEPIMLLKLPIMLLSIAPKFPLLCSNYAQLCTIMLQIFSYKIVS